jgi:hypothetical protein
MAELFQLSATVHGLPDIQLRPMTLLAPGEVETAVVWTIVA